MAADREQTLYPPAWSGLALWGIILLALPAHLFWMRLSIWMDEAWVANSVLAPSLGDMFFYGNWVQSTPALPLLMMRGCVTLFGAGEVSLRLIPWVAWALAAVLFAGVARRMFSFPLNALAVTLFCTNYWVIKYSQQVKQYTTDLLTSCIFIALIWRIHNSGLSRSNYIAAAAFGAVSTLLAWPAAFWLPSLVLCVLLEPAGLRALKRPSLRPHLRWAVLAGIAAASFALNYALFIRRNLAQQLVSEWSAGFQAFLSDGSLLQAADRLLANTSQLLLPRSLGAGAAAYLLLAIAAAGAVRTVPEMFRGDRRARAMFLAGVLPVLVVAAASFARRYPLLAYPRLILWLLPLLYLLLCYGLEAPLAWIAHRSAPAAGRRLAYAAVACCVLMVLATDAAMLRLRPEEERNREALTHIAKEWKTGDRLFVHGGVSEQFYLYERLLRWFPDKVYLGNTTWPCCALRKEDRVSNPQARTVGEDVESALSAGLPGTLWVFFPSGSDRHWSAGKVAAEIAQLPKLMAAKGCRAGERGEFGFVLVESFVCR